jgi:hypothetical protein
MRHFDREKLETGSRELISNLLEQFFDSRWQLVEAKAQRFAVPLRTANNSTERSGGNICTRLDLEIIDNSHVDLSKPEVSKKHAVGVFLQTSDKIKNRNNSSDTKQCHNSFPNPFETNF